MRTFATALVIAGIGLGGAGVSAPASAEGGPPVLQVIMVQVEPGKMDAYMQRVKKAQAIVRRLELPEFEVWQATMAGDSTGSLAIAIENNDLATLAANQATLQADPEYQKLVAELESAGLSSVLSNALWVNVTP